MIKKLSITFNAEPAFDMYLINGEAVAFEGNLPLEKLLDGYGIWPDKIDQITWVPMDLLDEDYQQLRDMGIEGPDLVPVFSGETFGDSDYVFETQDNNYNAVELKFHFDCSVYSGRLEHWWAGKQKERRQA